MDLSNLNFSSIAGLTVAGGIIATTWRHIATFGKYLFGIFIGTSILKDDAGAAAMSFAFTKGIRSPLGRRVFGGWESYVHPKRWHETVAYEGLTADPVIIKFGKQFALLSLNGQSSSEDIGNIGDRSTTICVRYFRWFFDIEQFTNAAIEHYNTQKRTGKIEEMEKSRKVKRNNRFRITRYSGKSSHYNDDVNLGGKSGAVAEAPRATRSEVDQMVMSGIFRLLKWKREDLQMQPEDGQSPFTGYPFPKEVEDAITELQLWLSHEQWFRSKSIPWRRGWLLYGPPGTGKSTLVRALGMTFDLPVYIFDLAGMTNDDLVKSWDDMMQNTPCIALIEDIDNIYVGREYVGAKSPNMPHVTFDCLLNCISGVKQADGVFLTITTNHVDKLDPAIGIPDKNGRSTRPGRIDKALCLGLMAEEQRLVLANHILSDFPELVEQTVKDGDGETAAQFQARCAGIALAKFWAEKRSLGNYTEVMHFDNRSKKAETNGLYGTLGEKPRTPYKTIRNL